MEKHMGMGRLPSPLNAQSLLDMYFLDARSALLETAATLDRIQRAEGGEETMNDARIRKLLEACKLLGSPATERAERFQLLFSETPGSDPGNNRED